MRISKADARELGIEIDWSKATEPVKPKAREPNKWEAEYGERLVGMAWPERIGIFYEAIKLPLADRTTYTPDWVVVTRDGIEFHEVKGFPRAAGMVKLKIAAEMYPWAKFVLATKKNGRWVLRLIPSRTR